ncbi:hypothetical protein [Bacillus cereus group sp. BfR-BA-01380]|uniref:hypothetical protein n=1 Tax=Bacillus cereus group sp. BfR-BA-01380 TaxID=2920324 RepID=UPI001F58450A|nr:hypothetical protein [Bacillus cereus group sp. BfR-BA-01380]
MTSRRNFYIIGCLFIFILSVRLVLSIMTDSVSFIELLMWGALAFLGFTGGYLYPQFKNEDERVKLIKQKGMYFSGVAVLSYFMISLVLIQYNIVSLTTVEIIRLLMSLTIITIFSSWIVLSHKY